MTKQFFRHFPIYFSIILLLTGCWDQVNIEDRGFVAGIAIDQSDDKTSDYNQITVMNQFVLPAKIGDIEKGGGEENPFTNLSASGYSLSQIGQELSSLTARQPFYEHLKVIVFSEELAREPGVFESLVDVFIRYHEMRRATRVFISRGNASDILDIEPETDKIPAMYIDSLIENSESNMELTEPVKLGDLHSFLLNEDSYAIPYIVPLDSRIEADGVSIFSGYNNQLVGKLNKEETKGLNLVTRKNKGGAINFEIDNHLMVYAIDQSNSSIKIDAKDPQDIKISVHIETEGKIQEMFGSKSLLDKTYMEEIEEQVDKRIKQLVTNTIEKAQNELKVDFFGFSSILRQRHYSIWKQIQENWERGDNLFSKSNITVSSNATILSIGATDRTKVKRNE